ncbi:BTB domain-containing protein [Mycena venus]|uniref:BTB domain-containing protein n=1 Tax=Mycena venus TaxID=2733690 RepID=A0A8H6YS64_9AGAR|nr:BTB domain-containing protein [Mycena venus]
MATPFPTDCTRRPPAGPYQIRMNATVYDSSNSPLATIITRSPSINITLTTSFQCLTPAFTPVSSVCDPAYSPLRIMTPAGGAVFPQNILNNSGSSNITGTLSIVDGSLDIENLNATLELVNLDTGVSTAAQSVPQTEIDKLTVRYSTGNITLEPGTWKLRMNFTDPRVNNTPHQPLRRILHRSGFAVCGPRLRNFIICGVSAALDNGNDNIGRRFPTGVPNFQWIEFSPVCFEPK